MIFTKLNVKDSKGLSELATAGKYVVVRYRDNPALRYLYTVTENLVKDLKNAESKGSFVLKNIRHDDNVKFKII